MKTYTHLKILITVLIAILSFTVLLTSCKNNDEPEMNGTASVRVIHSSETTGAVDLYANDSKINNSAIAYASSSTYFQTQAGQKTIQVRLSGSAEVVSSQSLNLEPGKQYTIYVTGTGNGAVVTTDDNSSPSSTQGKVRFVNLSSLTSNAGLQLDNSANLFTGITFGTVSDFAAVSPGEHTFKASSATNANLNAQTTINVQAGKIYTIYLSGTTILGLHIATNN